MRIKIFGKKISNNKAITNRVEKNKLHKIDKKIKINLNLLNILLHNPKVLIIKIMNSKSQNKNLILKVAQQVMNNFYLMLTNKQTMVFAYVVKHLFKC